MISSGVICVFIGMLLEMKTTEPYSPSARANASAKPVSSAGSSVGKMMRQNACQRFAPRLAAASSISESKSSSTGWTVRTTNGRPINVSATKTPSRVKEILIAGRCKWRCQSLLDENNWPIQPFSA